MQHFDFSYLTELANVPNISERINQLHEIGIDNPTIDELKHMDEHSTISVNYHWHVIAFYVSLILLGIFLIFITICCTNKIIFRKLIQFCLFSKETAVTTRNSYQSADRIDQPIPENLQQVQF